MIEIRDLTEEEVIEAVRLRMSCWQEELAGKLEHHMDENEEIPFWTDWMHHAKEHQDVRTLVGAFEHGEMLGAAFGSFAEAYDRMDAFELNGLWVYPKHRGKKISIMLIDRLLDVYMPLDKQEMIAYNHHYAPSNQFYRYLGGRILKNDVQIDGKLFVDVFVHDAKELKATCDMILKKG